MKRSALLGLLTAAAVAPGRAAAQEGPLQIGSSALDSSAEVFYAQRAGFFEAAGLNVEVHSMNNGAAIAAAIASGTLAIGSANIVSLVQAHQHHIPFVIIAPGGLYSAKAPSSVLVAPNGSTVTTGADLAGKTVGVAALRALPQYATQAWVDQHGGNAASLRFIELTSTELLVALREGRVDAAVLTEPFVGAGKRVARVVADCFDAIGRSFLINAHFTTLEWARNHPELLRRFQAVIAKAAWWANRNHPVTAEVLTGIEKLDAEVARTMERTIFAESIDLRQIQPVIDVTAKYGEITAFPAAELLYGSSAIRRP